MIIMLALILFSGCEKAGSDSDAAATVQSAQEAQGEAAPTPSIDKQTPMIDVKDILSVGLEASPLSHQNRVMLQHGAAKDDATIQTLVELLNQSVYISKPIYRGRHGYPPNILIQLTNNRTIEIEPAVDCITTQIKAGSETKCTTAVGEIFVYRGKSSSRLTSPDLYHWLNSQFKVDLQGEESDSQQAVSDSNALE